MKPCLWISYEDINDHNKKYDLLLTASREAPKKRDEAFLYDMNGEETTHLKYKPHYGEWTLLGEIRGDAELHTVKPYMEHYIIFSDGNSVLYTAQRIYDLVLYLKI